MRALKKYSKLGFIFLLFINSIYLFPQVKDSIKHIRDTRKKETNAPPDSNEQKGGSGVRQLEGTWEG
ncbi:MAG TPA: hypothetical protein VGK25_08460, partial [Ignavibacteria bacterium]